ncbi:hypothetical protein BW723_03740 [Polaribacter reichenbachii]|uniref:HTH lacI-type domain-containing protein n=1 Tax=Polaribacter reichenbachii TaxID=996801 RepID=A0A1B8TVB9_9FLAO|nr:LacI family DNA-binding transcriptional regulator [Polaribacter reichenbachii]APZ45463.1 hypothetical protein BW723_03740 [Polaribacter reichenbachii]AUC19324.1 hypothetical protein BTO17_11745 [Polaribacter reichenbachii]OBY63522.1 hypothetical protein LPB301_11965 [Polaribacter reichenbachii]
MITIKDIAREANVSEGTVDRVIHNRSGVSKKTEAKIRKILDHYNFKVNPVARALATKKKHSIAVLIPNYNKIDYFWKSPYDGIYKARDEVYNFGVEVNCFSYDQYNQESFYAALKNILDIKPSAVVIVPNFYEETKIIVTELEKSKIPYVFLNIDINGFNNLTYIGQNSYTAGYVAGKLMHLKNYKISNFLIIQSKYNITKNNTVSDRIKGFNDFFIKNNINSNIKTLRIKDMINSSETKEIINSYLMSCNNLKGIFVPSSRIHIAVDCMEKKYLKQLDLIGFDDIPENKRCLNNDSVSFIISQRSFDQGYKSIHILTDYLIYNKKPNNKVYLPIDILIKENIN